MKLPESAVEQFTQKINDLLSQGQQLHGDAKENVKALLHSQLQKLDVVSREEFDMQQQTLIKTRAQLVQMQQMVDELQEQVKKLTENQ